MQKYLLGKFCMQIMYFLTKYKTQIYYIFGYRKFFFIFFKKKSLSPKKIYPN